MLSCGNNAQQCRLGLFQGFDFAGDLEASKSSSGRTLCIFGSHAVVPISWMCKKETSWSHSSTESEIISLDAGLRIGGIPALDLGDLIIDVLHPKSNQRHSNEPARGNPLHCKASETRSNSQNEKPVSEENLELSNVDFVSSNANSSHTRAMLYIFEDNEAVIKMIIKGRSPTPKHVSRTQKAALEWFFDRIKLDPKIQIKCVDTKNQLADIPTKGNFTRDE